MWKKQRCQPPTSEFPLKPPTSEFPLAGDVSSSLQFDDEETIAWRPNWLGGNNVFSSELHHRRQLAPFRAARGASS